MKTKILTGLLILSIFSGCNKLSEKAQDAKNTVNVLQNVDDIAQNMEESTKNAEKKIQERRQRGDTVAMHYDKLKTYLPTDLQGYTPDGEPKGEMVKNAGMSFSTITQNYKKGESTMKVTLHDYNGVGMLYTAAFGMFGVGGLEVENDQEIMKGWDPKMGEVKGFEKYQKKQKDANVVLGTAERFVLIVDASGQENTDAVKSVAKSAKWGELSKM
ncbi:MAG: hypothetical protein K1X92_05990 [Bacteroidia bacterium]|nr:hypothetical protein [Bacteroidia bacterium]